MTKIERDSQDLIDLGTASVETRGSVHGNKPDGELPQQFIPPMGLAAD